jgi:multiple antibiotic resistance protein
VQADLSYAVEPIRNFSFVFMALFPVVNPIGCAPIFLTLAARYPNDVRAVLARKIALYALAILISSFFIGNLILAFFGISLYVLRIAGGLVLASTGWTLLNQKDSQSSDVHADLGSLQDALSHAFYPLTLPITVGPGCISVAITLGARVKEHGGLFWERGYGTALLAMVLICFLVAVCYQNADRLVRFLGESGTTIMIRISAFILLAIGVQITWDGLQTGLPQLLKGVAIR